jgi:CubicO group peptidase (beta-lactamase class C family)
MNLSPEILQTIHQCFTKFFETHKAPGLVYAVTYKGEVLHSEAFGTQRLNPNEAMSSKSVSRIASMTKSFAAVAALKLRDAGLLDIDAPISSIVPSMKLAEPFTSASVRNLMSMRLDLVTDDAWADRLLGATDEEIDPYFQQTLLKAGLGHHRCAYSNLSYFLLGRLIGLVSGQPLMEYISQHITAPLGMLDTVWNPSARIDGRVALGYRVDTDPPVEE